MHGCNAQGMWGSGIARVFAANYTTAYKEYAEFCRHNLVLDPQFGAVGKALLTSEEHGRRVGCLITSTHYGAKKDSPSQIIFQTILALKDLMSYLNTYQLRTEPIYCNKFNSGLFNVPWDNTERVLKYFAERYDLNFVVCDPEME